MSKAKQLKTQPSASKDMLQLQNVLTVIYAAQAR